MVDKYEQKEKVSETELANMFDWAVEARDVACSLTFIPRDISIPEVLLHPVPWDAWKWSHFIQDAHHFLKHYTEVDTTLDSKILKASYFYGDKWVDLLPPPVVQCMLRKDKNGKTPFYDRKHPLHLLRFVRNALVHRQDCREQVKTWKNLKAFYFFGGDTDYAETSFREVFPCLVLGFYKLLQKSKLLRSWQFNLLFWIRKWSWQSSCKCMTNVELMI